jgi:chromosome partitioning protein
MKIVALIAQKGGAGKTTMTLHLAVAAERKGHSAAVIDLDPQASASGWKDTRPGEAPAVVSAQASRLAQVLAAAQEHGAAVTFIDTPPHTEAAALAAARAADLILIPCRPAILDLRAIGSTVDLAKLAGRPAAVVLNAVPPRAPRVVADAIAAVAGYGVKVAPVHLANRAPFAHALTAGQTAQEYEPAGAGAAEVAALYGWLCREIGLS